MRQVSLFLILAFVISLPVAAQRQNPLRTVPRLSGGYDDQPRQVNPNAVVVARLHYSGGGDWYWGNSAIPNLLEYIRKETNWPVDMEEKRVKIDDQDLFSYPFLFATGHGTIKFTDSEIERLRAYLLGGGFLFINDSYGMDASVRSAVASLFPEVKLQEVPYDHPIYHSFYDFPNGPPKIHKHDGKPATGWGININGRLVVYYVHESDVGDGWEDSQVHHDPESKRLEALKMGLNIVSYAMTH